MLAGCAFVREHPRATTVAITTVVFSAGIGAPLSNDCSNETSTCSGGQIAAYFGVGAAVGFGLGLLAVHERGTGEPEVAPRTRTPWPEELPPGAAPVLVADRPQVLRRSRTIVWGNGSSAHDWMAAGDGPTPMRACANAKTLLLDELEDLCAENALPGIETHDLETRDCVCQDHHGAVCATRASVTCSRQPTDVLGTGVGFSDARTVAEADAEDTARARCTIAGLTPAPATTTCQCDVTTGECACVATAACD